MRYCPSTLLIPAICLLSACQSTDQMLLHAAKQADSAAIHRSLALGATPNTNIQPGETPLGLLLNRYRHCDTVGRKILVQDAVALLSAGADPNALHHGYTPLQIAAGLGNEELIIHLLAFGGNPSQETRAGLAPIWQCVHANDFRISLQLLSAGANPNSLNAEGQTPLQYLRTRGYIRTPLMLQLRKFGGH